MDGEEFEEGGVGRDGVGFGVEGAEAGFEEGGVDAAARSASSSSRSWKKRRVLVSWVGREPGVAAEGEPGALDELGGGEAGAVRGGGLEDGPDAGEAVAGIG